MKPHKILSYGDLIKIYQKYCNNIDNNTLNLGYPSLERAIRNFRKQELLTVLARSGVGKSILTLNFILNYLEKAKEIALVFSLEMSDFSIAERIMQVKLSAEGEHIEKQFINNNKFMIDVAHEYEKSLSLLKIVPDRIDIHDIPEYVSYIANKFGTPVGIILTDHLGLLRNRVYQKDTYNRVSANMVMLYNYAKDLNVGIINVSQIGREDAKKESITLYSGKESGEIENSSDFVVSFETVLPDTKDMNESYMLDMVRATNNDKLYRLIKLTILKNRRSSNFDNVIYVLLNTKTIQIFEYDETVLKRHSS